MTRRSPHLLPRHIVAGNVRPPFALPAGYGVLRLDRTDALFMGWEEPPRSSVNCNDPEVKYADHDQSSFGPCAAQVGRAGLFEVPRLEELVADPDKVGVLDAYAIWALRAQAVAALNLLNAENLRLLRRHFDGAREVPGERLLRIKEASEKFFSPIYARV